MSGNSSFLHNKLVWRVDDGGGVDRISELPDEIILVWRVDDGEGVDRISELPDEIIVVILSFLSLRGAARTSTLSSRWIDLWKHNSDRISQLPDGVIAVILSFLPLREAATTSVLSSRWLDLWKHTPNLDFTTTTLPLDIDSMANMSWMKAILPHPRDADKCNYIKLVNSVLESHKAPSLKQFSASFYVNKFAHLKVAKWLEFALSKGVERLVLDFQCHDPSYQVVLEELLLRGSGLGQASFRSLRDVSVRELIVSGEAIKMLLCNCPSLEALSIGFATLSSDVEVRGSSLMLKCLEIYFCTGDKSLKVSAPNLTSLMLDDRSGKLLLENVPKLVEAVLIFRSPSLDFASEVFCFSSQLKALNLNLQHPEILLANGFFPQMPNLNKLVVECRGARMQSLLPVTALVWASPRLEEFKLMVTQLNEVTGGAPVQGVRDVERSPHRHLKLFELGWFMDGDVRHVELANYILDNCVALQKIIIRCSSTTYEIFDKNQFEDGMQAAATAYAKQQFEGKIPQHIQLEIFFFPREC